VAYTFTQLDVPGATRTVATGINDAGQIVGLFIISSTVEHGFLCTGGGFTQLDVPGATFTSASGINDAGQIVGSFGIGTSFHGFLDTGGSFTQIAVPGGTGTAAFGINDARQIDNNTHGFLASPVPEPATLTVLSVGLILTGLGMMRRRATASEQH